MSDVYGFCVKHDIRFPTYELTTGPYASCDACQSETIEAKSASIRDAAIAKYGFMPRYTDANGVVHGSNSETYQMPDIGRQEESA